MENQNPQIPPIPPQNIPTEQPTQAPFPKTPNINYLKTIGIGMSIVSFCIGIAVIGYLIVLNKNTTKQVACTMEAKLCPNGTSVGRSGPKCEFAACPTTTPTPTIDPTASWKTYDNFAGKFSLKYPASWYTGVAEDGTILFNSEAFEEKNVMSPDQVAITLTAISNKSLIKEYSTNLKNSTTKNINGTEFIFIDLTPAEGPSLQVLFAQTIHNEKLYRFGLTNPLNQKEFNQIISTFKFTDQAVTPLSIQDVAQIKQLLAIQDNTTADKIIFTQDQQKYSNYASGEFGQTGVAGGAMWFAAKINNQWKIIFTGNGAIPNCSDIAQYNPPKDFLPCN